MPSMNFRLCYSVLLLASRVRWKGGGKCRLRVAAASCSPFSTIGRRKPANGASPKFFRKLLHLRNAARKMPRKAFHRKYCGNRFIEKSRQLLLSDGRQNLA